MSSGGPREPEEPGGFGTGGGLGYSPESPQEPPAPAPAAPPPPPPWPAPLQRREPPFHPEEVLTAVVVLALFVTTLVSDAVDVRLFWILTTVLVAAYVISRGLRR